MKKRPNRGYRKSSMEYGLVMGGIMILVAIIAVYVWPWLLATFGG